MLYWALTIAAISIILLLIRLISLWWEHPPQIVISLPAISIDISKLIPSPLLIQTQAVAAAERAGTDEPIDLDIWEYIQLESEPHARESRLRHARTLKAELGTWPLVLAALNREDTTR